MENPLRFDTPKATLAHRAASPMRGFLKNKQAKGSQHLLSIAAVRPGKGAVMVDAKKVLALQLCARPTARFL
jgi:hypothetical protein